MSTRRFWPMLLLRLAVLLTLAPLAAGGPMPVIHAQSAPPDFLGVPYGGSRFFVHGANLPWLHWGCDFGSGCTWGEVGVRTTKTQNDLRPVFADARAHGLSVVRWWLFPGSPTTNSQGNTMIIVDAQGKPTGIHPGVFADLDAAIKLASETGVRYNFTVFSSHMDLPSSWLANPEHRQALADVLGRLFARYAGSDRIFAWELFNEPEWGLGNTSDPANTYALNVKDLTRRVIAAQRATTPALVNLGPAWITFDFWRDLDVDFFSPHYYSNMTEPWRNALGTTAGELRRQHRITQPILLGEVYVGAGQPPPQQFERRAVDPLARYEDVLRRGYAGAWGWTLIPDSTSDKLSIDRAAAAEFARRYQALVGPREAMPPGPAPTSAPPTAVPQPTSPPPPSTTAVPTAPPTSPSPTAPTTPPAPAPGATDVLYDDGFGLGWGERWSWGTTLQPGASEPRFRGSAAYGVTFTQPWGGWRLMPSGQRADWRAYQALRFAIHGGSAGGQTIKVWVNTPGGAFELGVVQPQAGKWTEVTLPLPSNPALGAVAELIWQQHSGKAEPTLYLDRIELIRVAATPAPTASPPATSPAGADVLFDDGFGASWGERWSWGVARQPEVAEPRASGRVAYGVTYTSPWGGWRLMSTGQRADWRGYHSLRFAIHGGTVGGQTVKVRVNTPTGGFDLGVVTAVAGRWTDVTLPLPNNAALGSVAEVVWQQHTGMAEPILYLDRIELVKRTP